METVRCPDCGWRLFDADNKSKFVISIKCPRCAHIVKITKKAA